MISAGPVVAAFDNGFESDCIENVSGLCFATLRGDAIGTTEINAEQRIQFIGLAVNDSWIEERAEIELLPGGELIVIRPSSYKAPISIYRPLIDHVGSRNIPTPVGNISVIFNETGWGYSHLDPDLSPSEPIFSEPSFREYDDSEQYEFFERDYIRPPHQVFESDSDNKFTPTYLCIGPLRNDDCWTTSNETGALATGMTPRLILGLEFVEAAAGTDPTFGNDGAGIAERASATAPLSRASVPAPGAPLARAPDPARPLASAGAGGALPAPAPDAHPGPRAAPGELAIARAEPSLPPARAALPIVVAAVSLALAILLASLYSRLTREDARSGPTRERLLAILRDEGAQSLTMLGMKLGIDRKTVTYHARLLERVEAVRLERAGNLCFVLLPGQTLRPEHLVAGDASRNLLDALRARGGAVPRERLHDACPTIPQRTRNRALSELVHLGLVERAFEGNREIVRLKSRT